MKIGILNEISSGEKGVVLMPEDVKELVTSGNEIFVEKKTGKHIGLTSKDYSGAGAKVVSRPELLKQADMFIQIKAPLIHEFKNFKGKILLSMIHPPGYPQRVDAIRKNNIKCVALESLSNNNGTRLVEAVEMCGISVIYALNFIKKIPSEVNCLILGYGDVGSSAIKWCSKLDMNFKIVRRSDFPNLKELLKNKDLIINAIDWPIEKRRKKEFLITKKMIKSLSANTVILDLIAHSGGGAIETCHPTNLKKPWFKYGGVTHICLDPYPGLYPMSSSKRYSHQLVPIISTISNNGGLEGIEKIGEYGRYIKKAII